MNHPTRLEQELNSFGVTLDTEQRIRYREWNAQNPHGGRHTTYVSDRAAQNEQQRRWRARRSKSIR